MNNYVNLIREKEFLEEMIARREREIGLLPSGDLQIHRYGEGDKYTKWYVANKVIDKDGHAFKQRKYLSKHNRLEAQQLALRGLYDAELKDLHKELRAVNMYLSHYSKFDEIDKYIARNPEYDTLLEPYLKNIAGYSAEDIEWMNSYLPGTPPNPEERIYRTKAGIMVRSKNEVIIISNLVDRHIPFKYEERLDIPGEKYPLWPDIKILQPRTRVLFVWENFGMMEKLWYSNHTSSKLDQYRRAGFIPGRNMIMTFEDNQNFIDEQLIVNIIDYYFG